MEWEEDEEEELKEKKEEEFLEVEGERGLTMGGLGGDNYVELFPF